MAEGSVGVDAPIRDEMTIALSLSLKDKNFTTNWISVVKLP